MNFIEKLLGVSPDNGSGALEVTIILAVAAAIAGVVWTCRERHAQWMRSRR